MRIRSKTVSNAVHAAQPRGIHYPYFLNSYLNAPAHLRRLLRKTQAAKITLTVRDLSLHKRCRFGRFNKRRARWHRSNRRLSRWLPKTCQLLRQRPLHGTQIARFEVTSTITFRNQSKPQHNLPPELFCVYVLQYCRRAAKNLPTKTSNNVFQRCLSMTLNKTHLVQPDTRNDTSSLNLRGRGCFERLPVTSIG